MRIERKVDWLGLPVRKTSPEVGHEEDLSSLPLRAFLKEDFKPVGRYVGVKISSDEELEWRTGHYERESSYGGYFVGGVMTNSKTLKGPEINSVAVGPRRKSGKRVSFKYK